MSGEVDGVINSTIYDAVNREVYDACGINEDVENMVNHVIRESVRNIVSYGFDYAIAGAVKDQFKAHAEMPDR